MGFLLILAGIFLLVAPGPGLLTVLVGLGFIATEFLFIARILDWGEPRARSTCRWAKRTWAGFSIAAKIALIAFVLLAAAACGYGAYTWILAWVG